MENQPLGDVLLKLLSPLKISFEMVGKKIVLSKKAETSESINISNSILNQVTTISGKVTDKNDGSGLPGVNIGVKGTSIGYNYWP